jgi:hypothetical protein
MFQETIIKNKKIYVDNLIQLVTKIYVQQREMLRLVKREWWISNFEIREKVDKISFSFY